MITWIGAWLAVCLLPAGAREAAVDLSAWEGLASPYYAVRRAQERRLVHLPEAEGLRVGGALLRAADPSLRAAGAAWLGKRLEQGAAFDAGVLADLLQVETDAAVRDRLITACAWHADALPELRKRYHDGSVSGATLDRIVDARLMLLIRQSLHGGRIPGFFDGQFADLHGLDPTAYGRMIRLAWDPRLHFVVRALAVMAVQEARRADLLDHLEDLIIDAREEVDLFEHFEFRLLTRTLDDGARLSYQRAALSQYARFSLAKAGVDGPIRRKIAYLERTATMKMYPFEVRGLPAVRAEDGSTTLEFELAMDKVFEVAYHYQQLDEYDAAERVYRRIIDRPEPVRVKASAHYNLACIRALQGQTDSAILHLRRAFETGLRDPGWAMRDGDLESLREDPRFVRLIADALAGRLPGAEDEEP